MPKLHELLAAEKTPTAAWNQLREDTIKKFKNPEHFFHGHSKSLAMIEESPGNKAIEDQAREEKPVTTTVLDTLRYALDIFGKAEDLQYQKNATNRKAGGTVVWRGVAMFIDLPVDELLGLEARLTTLRQVIEAVPTLDATKHWVRDTNVGDGIWTLQYPEETTKTEKQAIPLTLKEATKEHPAQVQLVSRDVVVGKFTTMKRSGAATALQKANALKRIDELMIEVKKARMRANEAEAEDVSIARNLIDLILEPFEE